MVWSRHVHNTSALPAQIGSLERFAQPQGNTPLDLIFRVRPDSDGHSIHYDAEIVDADGRLILRLTDGESAGSPALNRVTRKA